MLKYALSLGVCLSLLLVSAAACTPAPASAPAAKPAAPAAPASGGASASAPSASAPSATAPATAASGAAAPAASASDPAASATVLPQRERLKVSWSQPGSGYMPLHAAQERGMFAARGLDVELVFIGGAQAVAAMLARELDIGLMDGSALVRASLAGGDLVAVGSTYNSLPFEIVGNPSIQRPEELRGKRLGITRTGSTSDFAGRYALRTLGLTPGTDVPLIQLGGATEQIPALVAGAVDGNVLGVLDAYQARQLGFRTIVDIGAMGLEYLFVPIGTQRANITERPAALRAFIHAITEAIAWTKQNRAEAMQVLANYTRIDDPGVLAATYDSAAPQYPAAPYATVASVATILESIRDGEPAAAGATPEQFIDDRFVRALDESGYIRSLYR